ncbi:hypothetical protein GW17_00034157 [Ensete ventricosum]|nr:hypothetical protein GW17_00034157 [Ensete ventricosum]
MGAGCRDLERERPLGWFVRGASCKKPTKERPVRKKPAEEYPARKAEERLARHTVTLPTPEIAADPTLITTDTPVAHPREKQLLLVLRRISCRPQHRLQAQALGSEPEGEGFTLRPQEKRPREKHHRPLHSCPFSHPPLV